MNKFDKDELWIMKDYIEELMWGVIREKDEPYTELEQMGFDDQINNLQKVIYLIENTIKETK